MPPELLVFDEHRPMGEGELLQRDDVLAPRRERLLAQHVAARVEKVARQGDVGAGRRGDVNEIQLAPVEQLPVVGEPSLDPETLGHGGGAGRRDVADCSKPSVFQ